MEGPRWEQRKYPIVFGLFHGLPHIFLSQYPFLHPDMAMDIDKEKVHHSLTLSLQTLSIDHFDAHEILASPEFPESSLVVPNKEEGPELWTVSGKCFFFPFL